jgi:hypothetical protein
MQHVSAERTGGGDSHTLLQQANFTQRKLCILLMQAQQQRHVFADVL